MDTEAIVEQMTRSGLRQKLLEKYRRIMDSIHEGGNIFYDEGRMKSYNVIALAASNLRREQ